MSKEGSYPCHFGCGMILAFPEYHTPHCKNNPANLTGSVKTAIEAKFTKAELATISKSGPTPDKPFKKKRGPVKRKKATAKR